jgi:hypothetical protein
MGLIFIWWYVKSLKFHVLDIEYMNKRLALTPKLVGPVKYALIDMKLNNLEHTVIQFNNVNRP